MDREFSVHDFVMEANRLIEEIIERGNVPIIVGGTGLYIQSLIEGYHLGGQENHQAMMELRETLLALTDEELFEKVLKLNPNFPELNRRRAIRFLELQTLVQLMKIVALIIIFINWLECRAKSAL